MNNQPKNYTSQNELIRSYLNSGGYLSALDALKMFGCMRLGARIYNLKQSGMKISRIMVEDRKRNKRYAVYYLDRTTSDKSNHPRAALKRRRKEQT